MIDLNTLASQAHENAVLRQNNGAHIAVDTRRMLKHTATEVVEATEEYTSLDSYDSLGEPLGSISRFASELADIICCALIIADSEHINIEKAVLDCIEKNRLRAQGKGDKL